MALPLGTTGSLSPTFVPARPVRLAVKLPSAFTLFARFPSALREPLGASSNCPPDTVRMFVTHSVRIPVNKGWYPNIDSNKTCVLSSPSPTYPVHHLPKSNVSYSKAPWGLSVQSRLRPPFTGASIHSFGLLLTTPLNLPAPG
ncbi:hypothetical protein Lal_00003781, partial [Lupinus albus]